MAILKSEDYIMIFYHGFGGTVETGLVIKTRAIPITALGHSSWLGLGNGLVDEMRRTYGRGSVGCNGMLRMVRWVQQWVGLQPQNTGSELNWRRVKSSSLWHSTLILNVPNTLEPEHELKLVACDGSIELPPLQPLRQSSHAQMFDVWQPWQLLDWPHTQTWTDSIDKAPPTIFLPDSYNNTRRWGSSSAGQRTIWKYTKKPHLN